MSVPCGIKSPQVEHHWPLYGDHFQDVLTVVNSCPTINSSTILSNLSSKNQIWLYPFVPLKISWFSTAFYEKAIFPTSVMVFICLLVYLPIFFTLYFLIYRLWVAASQSSLLNILHPFVLLQFRAFGPSASSTRKYSPVTLSTLIEQKSVHLKSYNT